MNRTPEDYLDLPYTIRITHDRSDDGCEGFVAEKVPAIMFVNEQQLHIDGQRDARVDVLKIGRAHV